MLAQRKLAAKILTGPTKAIKVDKKKLISAVREAVQCMCAYVRVCVCVRTSLSDIEICVMCPHYSDDIYIYMCICACEQLYASKICSYAQGMCLIQAASKRFGWKLKLGEIARIWKGGCIIRAKFLDRIKVLCACMCVCMSVCSVFCCGAVVVQKHTYVCVPKFRMF